MQIDYGGPRGLGEAVLQHQAQAEQGRPTNAAEKNPQGHIHHTGMPLVGIF